MTSLSRGRLVLVVLACASLLGLVGGGSPGSTPALAGVTTPTPAPPSSPTKTPIVGGPDVVAVGFSEDGSECDVGESKRTFSVGIPIHTVLAMEPALPTGGTVTITLEKDGVELAFARQTITVVEPAPCVWGTMPELEAGHYRMTYAISPSDIPPVDGEFDVTP